MSTRHEKDLFSIQEEIMGFPAKGSDLDGSSADIKLGSAEFSAEMDKTREQLESERSFSTTLSQLSEEKFSPTLDAMKQSADVDGIVKLISTNAFELRISTKKPGLIHVTNKNDHTTAMFERTPIDATSDDAIIHVAGKIDNQQYIFKQTRLSKSEQPHASKFGAVTSLERFIFINFDKAQDHLTQHNLIEGIRAAAKLSQSE